MGAAKARGTARGIVHPHTVAGAQSDKTAQSECRQYQSECYQGWECWKQWSLCIDARNGLGDSDLFWAVDRSVRQQILQTRQHELCPDDHLGLLVLSNQVIFDIAAELQGIQRNYIALGYDHAYQPFDRLLHHYDSVGLMEAEDWGKAKMMVYTIDDGERNFSCDISVYQ